MEIRTARYIGDLQDKSTQELSDLNEAFRMLRVLRSDADIRRASEVKQEIEARAAQPSEEQS